MTPRFFRAVMRDGIIDVQGCLKEVERLDTSSMYQLYERLLASLVQVFRRQAIVTSVSFALNLSRTGELLDLVDLRRLPGRSKRLLPEIWTCLAGGAE